MLGRKCLQITESIEGRFRRELFRVLITCLDGQVSTPTRFNGHSAAPAHDISIDVWDQSQRAMPTVQICLPKNGVVDTHSSGVRRRVGY